MNTKHITFALAAVALVAAGVAIAAFRNAIGIDGIIGYGAVMALIALFATDYRFELRRVFRLK